jgi:hypothetical protein
VAQAIRWQDSLPSKLEANEFKLQCCQRGKKKKKKRQMLEEINVFDQI